MRTIAALILIACVIAAIAASNRAKPMIVEAHPSGLPAGFTQPPDMLFAPCPTGPQSLRRRLTPERKA